MEIPVNIDYQTRGEVMSKITTVVVKNASSDAVVRVGIDLAKNVFAVHGVNAGGKPVLIRPAVRREQLLELLAQLPPCLI
jgi:transposase